MFIRLCTLVCLERIILTVKKGALFGSRPRVQINQATLPATDGRVSELMVIEHFVTGLKQHLFVFHAAYGAGNAFDIFVMENHGVIDILWQIFPPAIRSA